jgi:hypothetical protein
MSPLQVYAIMVLCAGDVDAIWHSLPAPNGSPTLPAPGSAGTASKLITPVCVILTRNHGVIECGYQPGAGAPAFEPAGRRLRPDDLRGTSASHLQTAAMPDRVGSGLAAPPACL